MPTSIRSSKRQKVDASPEPPSRSLSPSSLADLRPSPSPLTPNTRRPSFTEQDDDDNNNNNTFPHHRLSYVDGADDEREASPDAFAEHRHNYWRRSRSRSRDEESSDMEDDRRRRRPRSRDESMRDRSSIAPSERRRSVSPTGMPQKPEKLFYREVMVLKGHKKGVAAVKTSPDGKLIASCSADATVRIWDAATGKHLRTLEGHLAGISTVAWSPDSKTVASGSDDKSIRLWDVETGKAYPNPLMGHSNYVYSLAFSPKGNMLVSGSYDEAVFLWDVRSGRIMRQLPAHSDPVGGVDFVRDGTLIVSCGSDGLIRVWDTSTGQCLRTLVHEDNPPVSSVRFSPNGKYVLAWTLDSCVRLWNYIEGRCVKTYQGHTNRTYSTCGAFGTYGDGRREWAFVASGSEDGAVLLWDVSDKNVLQRLEGHKGVVLGVDAVPDTIISAGIDKTVRVWRTDRPNGHDRDTSRSRQDYMDEDMMHDAVSGEADGLDPEEMDQDGPDDIEEGGVPLAA